MEGLNGGDKLFVTAYPVAWRIETIDDGVHREFEYVRYGLDFTRHTGMVHRHYISGFTGDIQRRLGI